MSEKKKRGRKPKSDKSSKPAETSTGNQYILHLNSASNKQKIGDVNIKPHQCYLSMNKQYFSQFLIQQCFNCFQVIHMYLKSFILNIKLLSKPV